MHNVEILLQIAVTLTVGISISDIKRGLLNFEDFKEDSIKFLLIRS